MVREIFIDLNEQVMSISTFTVFAPQRSGTNFIQYLITENFQEIACEYLPSTYAWKHEPDFQKVLEKYNREQPFRENHLHLIVSKNPYKWIESIIRRPVDIVVRRPELLNIENIDEKYVLNLNLDRQFQKLWFVEKINLLELINLYNEFYSNWSNIGNRIKHWGLVQYERLLNQDECVYFLDNMHKTFQLKRINPEQWKIPNAVLMSEMWTDDVAKEKTKDYLDYKHCGILTQEQIDIIDHNINKSLLKDMNYPTEKPTSLVG